MTTDVIDVSGLSEADIQQVRELVVQLRTRPSVAAPLPPLMVQPGTVFGTLSRAEIYDDEDSARAGGTIFDLTALGLDKLPPREKLALAEALSETAWAEVPPGYFLTDAQREELDRRIADSEANPDDHVPWEEVTASIRKRLGR